MVLAQAVVNKLSDSLALVMVKKQCYSWSDVKETALVERMQYRQKRRSQTLGDTLEKVEAKILEDTHGEKLKEVKLEMLETQWPMCKAEAQVDPLANKLTKVDA